MGQLVHELQGRWEHRGFGTRNTRDFKIAKISIYTPRIITHVACNE